MKAISSLFLAAILFNASAHAAEGCAPDIEKFCAGVPPGGGAINACLQQHEAELSAACANLRQSIKDGLDAFAKACGADIKARCAKARPGGGRILACLKQNEASLSPECKSRISGGR
jgi:hypothetical protein